MVTDLHLDPQDFEDARRYIDRNRTASARGMNYLDPRNEARGSAKFSPEEFEQTVLYSVATEVAVRRLMGIPPKLDEDRGSDLPNGTEVMARSAKWFRGGEPYIVEKEGLFHPTLTVFRHPDHADQVDARFLLTPDMLEELRIHESYEKSWHTVRHRVDTASAVRCGGRRDVWERLVALTRSVEVVA